MLYYRIQILMLSYRTLKPERYSRCTAESLECLRQPKHQRKLRLANASMWNSLYMSNRNTFRLNWVADSTSQCFVVADNSSSPVLCKNKLVSPISFDRLKAS